MPDHVGQRDARLASERLELELECERMKKFQRAVYHYERVLGKDIIPLITTGHESTLHLNKGTFNRYLDSGTFRLYSVSRSLRDGLTIDNDVRLRFGKDINDIDEFGKIILDDRFGILRRSENLDVFIMMVAILNDPPTLLTKKQFSRVQDLLRGHLKFKTEHRSFLPDRKVGSYVTEDAVRMAIRDATSGLDFRGRADDPVRTE